MARLKRSKPEQVTLHDVSALACVSPITASRALAQPDRVAVETRQRVEAAAAELGYVPNLLAGGLVSRRTRLIAAIVPTVNNPVFGELIQGISDVVRSHGYYLLLGSTSFDPAEEEALIRMFLAHRPQGMVLYDVRHTPGAKLLLSRAQVAVVETGDLVPDPLDAVVSYSNFAAAREMTLYLAGRGYRRIAFVGGNLRENARAAERRRGFDAALRELGHPLRESDVREVGHGHECGAEALVDLLGAEPSIDAIFFAGHIWAIGAILECHRRGWSIPDRVAVAGFDDPDLAVLVDPPLTTVKIPRYEVGRQAAETLVRRLRGDMAVEKTRDLGFSIVARGSA